MARRSSINDIPADVVQQLDGRLLASDFSDYVAHAQWLHQLGFDVSKSSIHRYAQTNQVRILQLSTTPLDPVTHDIKVRCLEIAATLDSSTDFSSLTKNADDLLLWVYSR